MVINKSDVLQALYPAIVDVVKEVKKPAIYELTVHLEFCQQSFTPGSRVQPSESASLCSALEAVIVEGRFPSQVRKFASTRVFLRLAHLSVSGFVFQNGGCMPKARAAKNCYICEKEDRVRHTFRVCARCGSHFCSQHGDPAMDACTICIDAGEETD